ncbi:PIG-L family deacetylase [Plantibacter sp. Mn2098]|uniref:PIG-L family deacetylase n=1 Tax=Plantibacter sp. Mn2098 TaxID=3395266 RepID=UPI003BD8FF74
MVTFDHRDAGTPEEVWAASGVLDSMPVIEPDDDVDVVVVLAAHPDDETLGAGGLIARSHRQGAHVVIVIATDGERSHPDSPSTSAEQLIPTRRAEVQAAVDLLAPGAHILFLGLQDGGLREHRGDLERALGAVLDEAAQGTTVLLAPWRGDGHRDHRIAGEVAYSAATERGVTLLEYPIWLWHWADPAAPVPDWEAFRALRLSPWERQTKLAALDRYESQTRPLSEAPGDEAVLHPGMQQHFDRDVEVYAPTVSWSINTAPIQVQSTSLDVHFFDDFYAGRDDPWGFETRWYEQRKRAITLASMPQRRARSGLEVGCSTGVLTEALAARCDRLLGIDIAEEALARARRRLAEHPHVDFERHTTPWEWPEGQFDLIVLSEVGYYWGPTDLATAIDRAIDALTPDGVLIACHWRHPVAEYPSDGDTVHAALAERPELAVMLRHVEEDFVLEVFSRPPATSVARQTGLLL